MPSRADVIQKLEDIRDEASKHTGGVDKKGRPRTDRRSRYFQTIVEDCNDLIVLAKNADVALLVEDASTLRGDLNKGLDGTHHKLWGVTGAIYENAKQSDQATDKGTQAGA